MPRSSDSPGSRQKSGAGEPDLDPIPGSGVVGFGFNIMGNYDQSSLTSQLFTTDGPGTTKTIDDKTYAVPFNVAFIDTSNTKSEAYVTQSQQDFSQTFSQSVGVDVSYGAFSGEFDTAYSHTAQSANSAYYCWYDGSSWNYGLQLQYQRVDYLERTFREYISNLPDIYDSSTKQAFFDLFIRYGTHYVAGATLGASFRYYLAVNTSYSSSQTEISAKVELEYKALFVDAQAQSQTDWDTLSQSWSENRSVSVVTNGGDNSMAQVADPDFGDNFSEIFSAWVKSAEAQPAVVDFNLRRLDVLCGEKAPQVGKALEDFLESFIFLSSDAQTLSGAPTTTFQVSVFGNIIAPDPVVPMPDPVPIWEWLLPPVGGFQLVFLDADNELTPLLSRVYYMPSLADNHYDEKVYRLYLAMDADMASVTAPNFVVVLNGFALPTAGSFPQRPVLDRLTNWQARLEGWREAVQAPENLLNYMFIGGPGLPAGTPLERCETTNWTDSEALHTSAHMPIYATM